MIKHIKLYTLLLMLVLSGNFVYSVKSEDTVEKSERISSPESTTTEWSLNTLTPTSESTSFGEALTSGDESEFSLEEVLTEEEIIENLFKELESLNLEAITDQAKAVKIIIPFLESLLELDHTISDQELTVLKKLAAIINGFHTFNKASLHLYLAEILKKLSSYSKARNIEVSITLIEISKIFLQKHLLKTDRILKLFEGPVLDAIKKVLSKRTLVVNEAQLSAMESLAEILEFTSGRMRLDTVLECIKELEYYINYRGYNEVPSRELADKAYLAIYRNYINSAGTATRRLLLQKLSEYIKLSNNSGIHVSFLKKDLLPRLKDSDKKVHKKAANIILYSLLDMSDENLISDEMFKFLLQHINKIRGITHSKLNKRVITRITTTTGASILNAFTTYIAAQDDPMRSGKLIEAIKLIKRLKESSLISLKSNNLQENLLSTLEHINRLNLMYFEGGELADLMYCIAEVLHYLNPESVSKARYTNATEISFKKLFHLLIQHPTGSVRINSILCMGIILGQMDERLLLESSKTTIRLMAMNALLTVLNGDITLHNYKQIIFCFEAFIDALASGDLSVWQGSSEEKKQLRTQLTELIDTLLKKISVSGELKDKVEGLLKKLIKIKKPKNKKRKKRKIVRKSTLSEGKGKGSCRMPEGSGGPRIFATHPTS